MCNIRLQIPEEEQINTVVGIQIFKQEGSYSKETCFVTGFVEKGQLPPLTSASVLYTLEKWLNREHTPLVATVVALKPPNYTCVDLNGALGGGDFGTPSV